MTTDNTMSADQRVQLTQKILQGKLPREKIEEFVTKSEGNENLTAYGYIFDIAFGGYFRIMPANKEYQFKEWTLGLGAAIDGFSGILTTSCDSWDEVWNDTTRYVGGGFSDGGGGVFFNFFNDDSAFLAQFYALSYGVSLAAVAGSGSWTRN